MRNFKKYNKLIVLNNPIYQYFMIFIMIIFICLALTILAGAHYFLYSAIIRFFNISGQAAKAGILVFAIFLTVSFIGSSILASRWENIFTRWFYIISGFWLGLLTNLILAALFCWLIIWLLKSFGYSQLNNIVAGFLFCLALIYSLYGVWNAFNPVVRKIEVEMKNLPANWKNKTIVQLSDIHLGRVYTANFFNKIIGTVNSLSPEMVVITGDLYDGMGDNLVELAAPLNSIKSEQGTFFITGNHESYLGLDKTLAILEKTKIKILNDELININGLQLIGISYSQYGETTVDRHEEDVAAKIKKINFSKDLPSILLYHAPTMIEQIAGAGINLQLSGHTHKGQMYPFNLITKLIYKGYDYGLHKIGDYTLYTTNGVGTWGPPLRIGNRPEIVLIKLK